MGKKAKKRSRWVSTAIKRTLAERIQKEIIERGVGGYTALTGFVEDAIRHRLDELLAQYDRKG